MSKRIVALTVLACLGAGLIAYAQRPRSLRKAAKDAKVFVKIKDPSPPKGPVVSREQARRDFINRPYEGTVAKPGPRATGGDLALQRRIAAALEEADVTPPAREAHFSWIAENPAPRHNGWNANVVSVEPAKGGWTAKVFVSPRFDDMEKMGHVKTTDHLYENYFYDGKTIRLLGIEERETTVRAIMID
jgi:hypothetical protein